tara:strand:- start:262 stop:636 length:375 start_codon:yes stop_codon:yes gene_type:complete
MTSRAKRHYNWSEHKVSNKIKTAGYFLKRLKDNGFVVLKIWNAYSDSDPRRWTVLVDPGASSVFVTCYTNKNEQREVLFELNDGGNNFHHGFYLKTDSIEVIINELLTKGISNDPSTNPFNRTK